MDLALPLPIRGLIIGLTIAAAVGPITLLVIRRTIDQSICFASEAACRCRGPMTPGSTAEKLPHSPLATQSF